MFSSPRFTGIITRLNSSAGKQEMFSKILRRVRHNGIRRDAFPQQHPQKGGICLQTGMRWSKYCPSHSKVEMPKDLGCKSRKGIIHWLAPIQLHVLFHLRNNLPLSFLVQFFPTSYQPIHLSFPFSFFLVLDKPKASSLEVPARLCLSHPQPSCLAALPGRS